MKALNVVAMALVIPTMLFSIGFGVDFILAPHAPESCVSGPKPQHIPSATCSFTVRDAAGNKVEFIKPCTDVEIDVN